MRNCLRACGCQAAGVVLAVVAVAWLHRHADGLWFQGDAPRHAVNGLFWLDFLRTLPKDPIAFGLRYYARYPVIAPVTYPPLFYILEGLGNAMFGPSPYVGRLLVLAFACVAGLFTLAWARRWIGVSAGWAGVFLSFLPGMVVWSNSVMLNVPATALSLGSLYYVRRWLESGKFEHLVATASFVAAALLTYYPSASGLAVLATFVAVGARDLLHDRRLWWIAATVSIAIVPLVAVLALAPVHTARHLPTIALLTTASTWTYYWTALPRVIGMPALVLGGAGCLAGLASSRWRTESAFIVRWIVALVLALSMLPARDPRYVLLAVPAFVIGAAIGLASMSVYLRALEPRWQLAVLAAGAAAGVWSAAGIDLPQVSGFRDVAVYLREHGPTDAVLYDGGFDGLFGFYVRALDPDFQRRLVRADKTIYGYGPASTFDMVETSNVASTADVVDLVRGRLGCRWLAIEIGPEEPWARGARLLREALRRSEFELVRSFPISGAGERRVDLYRFRGAVGVVTTIDLTFPSLTDRPFRNIAPITR